MLEYGLIDQLKDLGWHVIFDGQMQSFKRLKPASDDNIGRMKKPRYVSAVCKEVADICHGHAKQKRLVLTLGGDHSIAMGTISGTARAYDDFCVVWVDAHAVTHPISQ